MKYIITRSAALCLCFACCLLVTACTIFKTQDPVPTDAQAAQSDTLRQTAPEELIPILHAGGAWEGVPYLNAQEAFLYYYEQGYRIFEYDLSLSLDGRLIGMHDGAHWGDCDVLSLTYEEFRQLRLENNCTPINEEWLIDTLRQYPDVTVVVDAKMPTTDRDAEVLLRIEELQTICDIDLSANIIPEVFSIAMWEILREHTSFERYVFSHYKVNYSMDTILEHFSDERICGIALPLDSSPELIGQLYRMQQLGKQIWVFTCYDAQDVALAVTIGADHVYVDCPEILP